jgi:hypothetical protein
VSSTFFIFFEAIKFRDLSTKLNYRPAGSRWVEIQTVLSHLLQSLLKVDNLVDLKAKDILNAISHFSKIAQTFQKLLFRSGNYHVVRVYEV